MPTKFWTNIKLRGETSWADKATWTFAEFVGNVLFMFTGSMGCAFSRSLLVVLETPIAFGLGLMIAMQCFGHISGGYINPLITITAVLVGRLSMVDALFYFLGEFLGAIVGYAYSWTVLANVFVYGSDPPSDLSPGFGSGVMDPTLTKLQGCFVEFVISFILTMVTSGIWHDANKTKLESISIRFGLTVVGLTIVAGPFTGAHMNPARTLAPAIFNNFWENHHLYWGGQLLGGILGAIVYITLFYDNKGSDYDDGGKEEA